MVAVDGRDLKLILLGGVSASAIIAIARILLNTSKSSKTLSAANTKKTDKNTPSDSSPAEHSEELIREQLSRNYAFLGDDSMSKIRDSFVIVIGMGGVGSWATTMLVRSGVSRVRLIDFDQVTLSSLNRHATAQLKDVGRSKVDSVKHYLAAVAPWCAIEALNELWNEGVDGDRLLSGQPDYVIDAIDHIPTKVALLKRCKQLNLKVLSCAGAGAKQDASRVQIADMSNTFEDPLARTIRRKLRQDGVGIPVVYSTEKPGDVKLLPLPEEEFAKGKVQELSAFDDFRVRLLPVLGPLPAMFGLAAATHILLCLAGKEDYAPLPVKNRPKVYEKVYRDFLKQEGKPTVYGSNE